MTFPNVPLQNGVEFYGPEIAGAFLTSVPNNIDTFNFGVNMVADTSLPYGQAIAYDTDGGATIPVSGVTAVTDIAGFLPYKNNGIMEDKGMKKGGLYSSLPVLNYGRMFVPVTTGEVMVVGDTVSLNLAAGVDFNTVRKLPGAPAASDLDISTIATVAQDSNNGIVLLTINKYLK